MLTNKIHPKYTIILTAGIMALIMSSIISLVLTLINGHFNPAALAIWPSQWLKSFAVGWPVAALVLPFVRRLVSSFIASDTHMAS